MYKYKVSFWFGLHQPNPFMSPNKVVEIESEQRLTDNEATLKALEEVGSYPRTYSRTVKVVIN